jgi:hypothetical protein
MATLLPRSLTVRRGAVAQYDPARDWRWGMADTRAEVERASENLIKSGKPFGPGFAPQPGGGRRESMPMVGGAPRPYPDYGTQSARPTPAALTQNTEQRMGGSQRHGSVSEYDGARPHSTSNAQGFYQNQRYAPHAPRPNDADQMVQAKRRMAAQRERELRNYHQEQQYHRSKDSESGQQ